MEKMKIVDTHAHYDDEAFDPDRDALLGMILPAAGVDRIINVGADMAGAEASARLSERYDFVYAGCGIHPDETGVLEHAGNPAARPAEDPRGDARRAAEASFSSPMEALRHLEELVRRPKTVAVGEIGLDYHWMVEPKDVQIRWFSAQLLLARMTGLPVNIHSRNAAQDTFDVICDAVNGIYHMPESVRDWWSGLTAGGDEACGKPEERCRICGKAADRPDGRMHRTEGEKAGVPEKDADLTGETVTVRGPKFSQGGIIHCYSGSREMAREYVKMGFRIGIGGVVTFKNSKTLRRTVEDTAIEHLVTETDCPYMTPEPNRGRRNDSSNIRFVIEEIAKLKDLDAEECAKSLRQNAYRLFGL